MGAIIGIDLGTTFSAIAKLNDAGAPEIVKNALGQNITPSCIQFFEDGTAEVGEEARKSLFYHDANCIGRFKRKMGTPTTYTIRGEDLSPTDLSAIVLKKLVADATAKVGEISQVVVTVPACFGHDERQATMQAAKDAGLNVEYIIDEPTAAALYYGFKQQAGISGTYAVYDLGGGTFDVSIIQVTGQAVEVLSSDGVSELGGHDFDMALQKLFLAKFKDVTGESLDEADFDLNAAEEMKKSLSSRDSAKRRVNREVIEVTRQEFEEAVSTLLAQTVMMCETALIEAEISASDLQGVILAGGSTRIPAVQDTVRKVFGQEPTSVVNVDEVVALGAVLYAAYKGDRSVLSPLQNASVEKMDFAERTHRYFGTLSVGFQSERQVEKLQNSIIIPRNHPIPCSVTKTYLTISDNQQGVDCSVTETKSPETDPNFVKIIHEESLELPPGRPAGQEIEVTYGFDANVMMTCSFKDVATGRESTVNLVMASERRDGDSSPISRFEVE